MRAKVFKDKCIGCGQCEATCDDVFRIGDDGYAETIVDEIPKDVLEDAQLACESCPTEAITIEENAKEEKKSDEKDTKKEKEAA